MKRRIGFVCALVVFLAADCASGQAKLSWTFSSASELSAYAGKNKKTFATNKSLSVPFSIRASSSNGSRHVTVDYVVGTAKDEVLIQLHGRRYLNTDNAGTGTNRTICRLHSDKPVLVDVQMSASSRNWSRFSASVDARNDGRNDYNWSAPAKTVRVAVGPAGVPFLVTTTSQGPGTLAQADVKLKPVVVRQLRSVASTALRAGIGSGADVGGTKTAWPKKGSVLGPGFVIDASKNGGTTYARASYSLSRKLEGRHEVCTFRAETQALWVSGAKFGASLGPNDVILSLTATVPHPVNLVVTPYREGSGKLVVDIGNDGSVEVRETSKPRSVRVLATPAGTQVLVRLTAVTAKPATSYKLIKDVAQVALRVEPASMCDAVTYGKGCGAKGPTVSMHGPVLPNDYALLVRNVPPRSLVAFAIGYRRLDAPLLHASIAGCRQHAEPLFFVFETASANGVVGKRLTLPASVSGRINLQALSAWLVNGQPRLLGSNGLEIHCD